MIGERGTGKELFARQLHAAGRRPDERFVRVDCAEPSAERLEHELFERERGGSAPAAGHCRSTICRACRPTCSAVCSTASARPRPTRAGRRSSSPVWIRQIAPQRRSGRLDGELIDHLCPVEVALPALRQRRSDIPVLVQHFLARYAGATACPTARSRPRRWCTSGSTTGRATCASSRASSSASSCSVRAGRAQHRSARQRSRRRQRARPLLPQREPGPPASAARSSARRS